MNLDVGGPLLFFFKKGFAVSKQEHLRFQKEKLQSIIARTEIARI
jgi:hypothetical protein